jgi:hypothetical protein
MYNCSKIIDEIPSLFSSFNDQGKNVNSAMLGYKYVNGIKTDKLSLIFYVDIKKPISQLSANEIIPSSINVNGNLILTDVIEDKSIPKLLTCYDYTWLDGMPVTQISPGIPEILKLQGYPNLLLPLMGGQEILSPAIVNGDIIGSQLGTLGFIAIDNEDNRPIGVTNAHVACKIYIYNADPLRFFIAPIFGEAFKNSQNFYEPFNFLSGNYYREMILLKEGTCVIQSSDPATSMNEIINCIIKPPNYLGFVKRHAFIDTFQHCSLLNNGVLTNCFNELDVAILSLNPYFLGNDSWKIHTPTGINLSSHLPFASTEEIDNILLTNPKLYSTGRTTGPKGWGDLPSCRLRVSGIGVTEGVGGIGGVYALFTNLIKYTYEDNSNFPSHSGDSGSALLAEINGQLKIIGLVFASNSIEIDETHFGLACRIDKIATQMNIRPWLENDTPNLSSGMGTPYGFTVPVSEEIIEQRKIIVDNKTYYNVGISTNSFFNLHNSSDGE